MSTAGMTALGFVLVFVGTAAGAAVVFVFKKDISPKFNTLFLGFAAGIMIAASVWSLIIPSIDGAESYGKLAWLPAAIGIVAGGIFLTLLDKVVPHMHIATNEVEGMHSNAAMSTKMFLAVTIHNIPEGLAAGVVFGAAAATGSKEAYFSALVLAIGMAVQNFPEGAAVALPLRAATGSRVKAFLYGAGSGIVEPIFAIFGYFLTSYVEVLQPWLLAFAAGAMLFVVAEDLIPEAKLAEHPHLGTWGVVSGFVLMMILDVALGA